MQIWLVFIICVWMMYNVFIVVFILFSWLVNFKSCHFRTDIIKEAPFLKVHQRGMDAIVLGILMHGNYWTLSMEHFSVSLGIITKRGTYIWLAIHTYQMSSLLESKHIYSHILILWTKCVYFFRRVFIFTGRTTHWVWWQHF